jgi:hypothetical protein
MKCLLTITLVALFAASALAQEPKTETSAAPWFDMKTCEICKCMADHEDMVKHMKWETHLIPDGLLSIAVMPEEMKETMIKAKKEVKATIARLESGEKVKCCGYCQSMGTLLQAGAKQKELSTVAGDITLITSTDAKVVERIHAHAKRTIAEHKKMMNEMKLHQHENVKKGGSK